MKKRGQLTIFIILAILVVVIALLIFRVIKIPGGVKGVDTDSVYNFVDSCLEEVGEEVIYQIGQNGGYYLPSSTSTSTGIPYYYLNKENLMPAKEKIEIQISFFIKERLFFCTKNFVDFPDYNISQGNISVKATIYQDKIKLKVDYPIRISKGEESSLIRDFEREIPVRLGLMYDSISEVLNSSEYGICLTCLYDLAEENDFYVEMLDYDKNTVIIIFIDKNSIINKEEFEYVYAVEA
jgi:hypothetical protein